MKKLQLIYFNLRALCEAPRMMLHQSNISYSYEMAWNYFKKPWREVKQEIIFHRLPLLIVDEEIEIWQSNAISRYIAKLTNNIPKDDVMAAYADSIFESAHDLFFPLNPTINIFTGDNHINNKKKLIEDILPRAFINFNKLIDKFEGNFFLGERAYYCDYNVFHHLSLALLIDENILNNYPKLNKFMIDFASQNGIKKYLDSRPQLVGIGIQPKVIIDEKQYATGTNPDYDYQ
ncbi:glutathione S-transferase [Alphaproteobacteria bacterium]|jgi:glutathione S-transferase|nr:glutathione S-transferase [Alphaproteobacteria bacterium]